LIMLWQVLYAFFSYAEVVKREPGSLGTRRWSLYGRLYLRHFNELDHELQVRLSRAYRPASHYLSGFSSNLMAVVARNLAFLAGSVLAVLLLLTIYDEDVITVEHVITIITISGGIVAGMFLRLDQIYSTFNVDVIHLCKAAEYLSPRRTWSGVLKV